VPARWRALSHYSLSARQSRGPMRGSDERINRTALRLPICAIHNLMTCVQCTICNSLTEIIARVRLAALRPE